jgi:uncharacterized protein
MQAGRPPPHVPDLRAAAVKFLPQRAPIEQFGAGGFRFADMSHQGGLMVLPSGMRACPVTDVSQLTVADLAGFVEERDGIDFVVIATGDTMMRLPRPVEELFRGQGLSREVMATSPAVHVYNVVVGEGRRVAALLLPTGKSNG